MKNLVVVDNFYKEPDRIREFALSECAWLEPGATGEDFPGTESKQCFFSASVVERLSFLIGSRVYPKPKQTSFGAFGLTLKKDNKKRVVHVDACEWTGIVYLTPEKYCRGGTTLYKHRPTGLNRLPANDSLCDLGFRSLDEFKASVLDIDSGRPEKWDVDTQISMRFNRLVLFRAGKLFHGADEYFGDMPTNGRLIQLFFFNEEED